jgi:hypothetical protein
MLKFDARSAYRRDFRFIPGMVAAAHNRTGDQQTYKVWARLLTRSHPGYPAAAEALGVVGADEVWELWKDPDQPDNPDVQATHRLTIDTRPVPPVKIVAAVVQTQYNAWTVRVTEGVSDG